MGCNSSQGIKPLPFYKEPQLQASAGGDSSLNQAYPVVTVVSSVPPASMLPHKFDLHYKRGRVLGSGGYSTAVEAFSRVQTGKKVAAKITQKGNLSEEDILSIESEILLLKEIDHPSIVKYIDDFEDEENYYVCLELLEGGELFDRIVDKSQYDEGEARDLFLTIMHAIKYLHDRNIVHRDLKPENLLMLNAVDDTAVKIADFGFGKKADGLNLTTQCGSPGYVAPEILKKMKYGKPVDMWAMGVITYIILSGYPPFSAEGGKQSVLFDRIKKGQYEFDPDYWGHVSSEAKDLIRGLLTLDPTARLTADQVFQHPWIAKAKGELSAISLNASLIQLKTFNANRRFKGVAKAVMAIRKMSQLAGIQAFAAGAVPPPADNNDSEDEGDDNEASAVRGAEVASPSPKKR